MNCLKGSPNSEIKSKGRLQWTDAIIQICRTRLHYLNITPKHLIFTSSLLISLHFTRLSVEEELLYLCFFTDNGPCWFPVYKNNLWIPLCKLTETLVVENVCISQIYIFTNERETLLFNMYPSELHTSLKI